MDECDKHEKEEHYRRVFATIGDARFKPYMTSSIEGWSNPYLIPDEKLEVVDWYKSVNGYTVELYSKDLSDEAEKAYKIRVLDVAKMLCEKEIKLYSEALEYLKHEKGDVKE